MSSPRRLALAALGLEALVATLAPGTANAGPLPSPTSVRALDDLRLPGRGPGSDGTGPGPTSSAAAPAVALPFSLPAPTGSLPVGATTLRLVDRSRTDPWVLSSGPRRIVVTLFYPALTRGGRPWQYMTKAESEALSVADHDSGYTYPEGVPDTVWRDVVTGAQADALPRPELGGRPLVLLSPGFGMQRSSLTGLATDLASRGSIVALMDHTYENVGESLGGGALATCVACDQYDAPQSDAEATAVLAKVVRGRATDTSFVLDQLLTLDLPVPRLRFIDPRRIAMVGHSIGGAAAAAAMAADRRIAAGANLDGAFWEPFTRTLSRPFLILGTGVDTPDLHPSWIQAWPFLTGFRHVLVVAPAFHTEVTDYGPMNEQLGEDLPSYGFMTGARAMTITRAYVTAFLDRTLRGQDPALMRGPSPAYPEVTFRDPA